MKQKAHSCRSSVKRFGRVVCTTITALALIFPVTSKTFAQTATNITSSGLNTVVTPPSPGGAIHSITGGTPVGTNLFHSFGEFSVGRLDTAQFQTTNLVPTASISNILGRVTGGNPSSIFGAIDSASYYPGANLFLLNPAGIVFGPNATLNVAGSVNFTTADYLRLADNVRFNAVPNSTADALLSASPVAAFGFLDLASGMTRGIISVQGSTLSVPDGQSITLVGGDVIIGNGVGTGGTQAANLSAPNGQIHIASANSVGEFQHHPLQAIANADGQAFSTYGLIALAPNSLIDVTHGGGGTVSIRGGEFVLNVTNSILTTSTAAPTAPAENSVSLTGGSLILSGTTSGADGAAINISTDTLEVKGASQIVSSNEGSGGLGGDTTITATKSVTISGYDVDATSGVRTDFGTVTSGVFAGTTADGTGGALTITTPKLTIQDSAEVATLTAGAGSGQTMTLDVRILEVKTGGRVSTISGWNYLLGDFGDGTGQAGMINILGANSISVDGTGPFNNYSRIQGAAYSFAGGGSAPIEINAPSATVTLENGGRIETLPGFGAEPTGNITLTIRNLNITNGSLNTIGGDGRSGNIVVNATGTVSLSGEVQGQPFPINNENGGSGGTGIVSVETGTLTLSNRARILNSTFSDATPSTDTKISIHATESVAMSGGSDIRIANFLSDVGGLEIRSSNISLSGQATINTVGFGNGNSGPITINAQNFSLTGGSKLNSSILSGSSGQGGSITIQGLASPAESVLIDGIDSGLFSNTRGAGIGGNITVETNTLTMQNGGTISASTSGQAPSATGGNITLTAGQSVTLNNGGSISASSTGPGNAGTISVNAGQQLDMQNSSITTQANQASGGNINIQAVDQVRLVDSTISTSVLGGGGGGGNISIDPTAVILQNSQILAQAFFGNGGNITITTPLFLADQTSLVSASSQFGLNGTVNIQSPTSNLSGTVSSLPSSMRQAQSLQTGRCAALANSRSSSLIVAGRDTMPTEPGGWLPSPFALTGEDGGPFAQPAIQPTALLASAHETLSLRRLTPAGFLTQHFAESELTGCRS